MELSEQQKAELATHHAHRIETYKSMISISTEGFKYLAVLNGGAAAGMLATIDKLRTAIEHLALQKALLFFVAGLVLNGFGIATSYLTQMAVYNESISLLKHGRHRWLLNIAVFLYVLSLTAFCVGATTAMLGLKP